MPVVAEITEALMDTATTIYINNDLDIVMVRMQARTIAKTMGFSTADQAYISMAASELARLLSDTRSETAQMVISNDTKNGHQALQIVCLIRREYIQEDDRVNGGGEIAMLKQALLGACKLVDKSCIEMQDDQQVRVTLTKWLK